MAQKKGGGSTRNGRDSKPKMLGVKAFGGELISAGSIIVQSATKVKQTKRQQEHTEVYMAETN